MVHIIMVLTDKTKQQPFISIVIATLNAENTIEKCLKSIVQQSAINKIEILVKDGVSTDRTAEILKKYDKYISYQTSSKDAGIYDAWNSLLPEATGQWIIFLGADDTLFDNSVVSTLFSALEESGSDVDLAYGKVRLVNSSKEKILDIGMSWNKAKNCIKEKMCIPHQGILHKTTLFSENGYFSTEYKICSDYEFIRRVLEKSNVLDLNILVSSMELGGISSNPNYTFMRLNEVRLINKKYGSRFPGIRWIITYTNACFRHLLFLIFGDKYGRYILDRFRKLTGLPLLWTKF